MPALDYTRWDGLLDSSDDDDEAGGPRRANAESHAPPPARSVPQQAPDAGGLALCSTMKDVGGRIASWVRWHTWLGFERLYIFFDSPDELSSVELARAAGGRSVVPVMRGSKKQLDGWRSASSWQSLGVDADRDVQIRQLLNAQAAMSYARADGLSWLLHLDSDELFVMPLVSAGAARRHFDALAAGGCECFVYHNMEGVPESMPIVAAAATAAEGGLPAASSPSTNPFTSIDLFKVCESRIQRPNDPDVAGALAEWRKRTRAGSFFLYYESGKCACRVDTDGLWVPVSVHLCLPRRADSKWDHARMLARGWTNDVRNAGLRHHTQEGAAVLHYPLWDPRALWLKYQLHGNFSNEIVAGRTVTSGLEWGKCFHVECRDHYLAHQHEPDGGLSAMTQLFRDAICLEDPLEAQRQVTMGVLTRFGHVKAWLARMTTDTTAGRGGGSGGDHEDRLGIHLASYPGGHPDSNSPAASSRPVGRDGNDGQIKCEARPTLMTRSQPPGPAVWTAGQQHWITPWQHCDVAADRASWRGPRRWKPREHRDG